MTLYGTTYQAEVPDLSDAANIVTAFEDYHDNIESFFALKANLASPTFTGTLAAATVSISGSLNFANIIPTSNTTGIITVNNTSTTSPGTYTGVGRIFVQQNQPNANVAKSGDLWMW